MADKPKKKASDILERMRGVATRPKPISQTKKLTGGGDKKTRMSIDLSPKQYKFVKRVAFENNARAVEVVRAALSLLEKRPDLLEDLKNELS
jgi:hypothetical protein